MKSSKRQSALPMSQAARIAFEIDALRARCSKAAQHLLSAKPTDELELEECARLDDGLARAQAVLKTVIAGIMLSQIKRRSRRSRAK